MHLSMKYPDSNCSCHDSNWGFSFSLLKLKKKSTARIKKKKFLQIWNKRWKWQQKNVGEQKKKKIRLQSSSSKNYFSAEQFLWKAPMKRLNNRVVKQTVEMGFSISNTEGCHKWKKIGWFSNFYFTIKWLMWILVSLWVAIGTVSSLNATCYDLWLLLPWLILLLKLLPRSLTNDSFFKLKENWAKKKKISQATEV